MPDLVKVEDLEVFRLFRAALVKFSQNSMQALTGADSQISRTRTRLEGELPTLWQMQLRKRMEAANRARDAVRQKKLYKDFNGQTKSAIEEEKALAKCMAAVEEAQRRLESISRWRPRLEKASDMYRGGVSPLTRNIEGDIPRAIALLDRLAASLEQYVQMEASVPGGSSTGTTTQEPSISRDEGVAVPPSKPVPAPGWIRSSRTCAAPWARWTRCTRPL